MEQHYVVLVLPSASKVRDGTDKTTPCEKPCQSLYHAAFRLRVWKSARGIGQTARPGDPTALHTVQDHLQWNGGHRQATLPKDALTAHGIDHEGGATCEATEDLASARAREE